MNAENRMQERMQTMLSNDRIFAYVLLGAAWVAVWFVVDQVAALAPKGLLMSLVYASALAICVFNTASILAMVKHFGQTKDHIYRRDIEHLDAHAAQHGH